ncbi:MAG: cytochrome c [Rhodospirillales bacterium]
MSFRPAASLIALAVTAAVAGPASSQTMLARGEYLVKGIAGCGNCHDPRGGPAAGKPLAGGFALREEMFTAVAPNITPDPETGIGKWTDAQIEKAIREGVRPDGTIIGPPMPIELYRQMSDSDVKAIVAYIKTVPPVKNAVAKSEYKIPLPPSYGPPVGHVPDVPKTDKVAYGAYLAGPLGHCIECHTPMDKGRRQYSDHLGAGGQPFAGPWGVTVAANITSDRATGIGSWTDAEIKTAITSGVRPNGEKLRPPMAYELYKSVSAEDMDAIVAYLRTIRPLANVVKEPAKK